MTLKQARALMPGDKVTAIVDDPGGRGSHWDKDAREYVEDQLTAGEIVTFDRLIPKVRIVNRGPWQDGHDQQIFGQDATGVRVWLGIKNAKKVEAA